MNSGKAIVATGHPLVSAAAVEILEKGGNAFDAAIAAGFMGAVAEPALTSLGGGGFLLARTSKGDEVLFDFFSDTPGLGLPKENLEPHFFPITVHFPGSEQIFNIGMGSVAVPGNLKGFIHVHERLGRLGLREIVSPAAKRARKGIPFTSHQAYFMGLLKPIMTLTKEGKKLYAPDGNYVSEGTLYTNPDYADFLETLPHDQGKNFYQDDIAERIVNDMAVGNGLLTIKDLASYKVKERKPLECTYRDRRLITNPPPSFGGTLIALALRHLEKLPLSETSWGSFAHLFSHASVMKEVDRRREGDQADSFALSEHWRKTTSKTMRLFSKGTTHVSIVDKEGNVAGMTTSNGEGSGYIVPGTGIMLNNMMGEDDLHPDGFHSSQPGVRISSMMSPSILTRGNEVKLVLGSGGSKRIRSAITQVISNHVDFRQDISQAVEAPRLHWDGETLQMEPGFSGETLTKLTEYFPTNVWKRHDLYFGGVHAIDSVSGAGDKRRGGNAVMIDR